MNSVTIEANFRSFGFDHTFINFVPLLAIVSAIFVVNYPQYFEIVLSVDLFLLGYHHVISTYTRLSKSNLTDKEFKFLVYVLPFLILGAVVLCASTNYIWLIPTIYLYWQWWHYTRQSEGISKSIRFKTKSQESASDNFSRCVFYMVPIVAILLASARQHATFLFMPVKTIPIPMEVMTPLLIACGLIWLVWFTKLLKDFQQGKIAWQFLMYQLSHHCIYLVSYILINDITIGWLAINIWHNFQYILFVWHVNLNKFKRGFDPKHPIISWISQPSAQRIFIYFSTCLILTYIFYSGVGYGVSIVSRESLLPIALITYQTINFHHYVVDTLIWKLRKPALRESVGIKA